MSAASNLSAVHRGVVFETKCMRLLQENLSMSLQRVGGASDGGIDLQGWWWLPTSEHTSDTDGLRHYKRMRVLAQCKAEKRKTGPAYLREMEGVLHRHVVGTAQTDYAAPTLNQYPTVAMFLSLSPFTKQALLRAHSSPFPFCLLHLPEPEELNTDEESRIGSIILNHALSNGVLHGEIEARWERSMRSGDVGRPGLWWNERRIPSWTPEDPVEDVNHVQPLREAASHE